jgi:hypothetical protein
LWSEDRWTPWLRQGDVFGPIYFPLQRSAYERIGPAASPAAAVIEPQAVGGVEPFSTGPKVLIQTTLAYAMVVSHDCEFNPGKRNFFLAARVDRLPHEARNDSALIDELRAGNDYRARSNEGNPIDMRAFFLEPIPNVLDDEPGYVANFTSITPFSMKFKEDLLKLKRAEFEHSHREQLRTKLAVFFGRSGDDVSNELKVDRPTEPETLEWKDPPPD